jgi:hypothetical protein
MNQREAQAAAEEHSEPSAVQERLSWRGACRDNARVAQALYAGEAIEERHELSEAGLLDEFFVFLQQVGMLAAFRCRFFIPSPRIHLPATEQAGGARVRPASQRKSSLGVALSGA